MNKQRFIIIVFLLVLLVLPFGNKPVVAKNNESVEKAHKDALKAIETWLNKIPKSEYKKAESEMTFQWKLNIEESQKSCERFKLYNDILKNIENQEFVYNASIFNDKTIRYYQLSLYVNCYDSQGVIEPSKFLKNMYAFYKGNISSINEQWIWLDQFLSLLGGGRFGSAHPELTSKLAKNSYETISNLLKEYLFVSDNILEQNSELIKNKDTFYAKDPAAWATYNSEALVLRRLYNFVKGFQEYLEESEEESVRKFLLPEFQDNDYTVKTYSLLRKVNGNS